MTSAFVCACFATSLYADTRIALRGDASPIDAETVECAEEGVRFAGGSGRGVVAWDRVLDMTDDAHAEAERWEGWEELADRVFRARVRIQRGDWRAAEPLLEELAANVQSGPTAAVVFEGLASCRVHRGAYVSAVLPWLRWARVQDARDAELTSAEFGAGNGKAAGPIVWVGGEIAPTTLAAPVMDAGTRLCPSLPPIWLADAGVRSAAEIAEWDSLAATPADGNTPRGASLVQWYRAALRRTCGIETPLPTTSTYDPGVRLVADIVTARFSEADARAGARAALQRRVDLAQSDGKALPRWIEAWCRAGIGGSLLQEESVDDRRRGVVQLLHVPARFGNEQPYLAGVCLAESAAALAHMGDTRGASALKAELARRYPGHSALAWEGLSAIGTPTPATKGGS